MKRIAENIIFRNEFKTKLHPETKEEVSYREFDVVDKDNNILETMEYYDNGIENPTIEEITKSVGIKFGVSTWVLSNK